MAGSAFARRAAACHNYGDLSSHWLRAGTRVLLARGAGLGLVALLVTWGAGACSVSSSTATGPPPILWEGGGGSGDDAGTDAHVFGGDASACQPGDVATWQAGKYHAAAGPTDACAPSGVAGFYEACLGAGASAADCAAFKAAHPDCYACILTPDTADHYGPLVQHGSFATTNVAGCIELSAESAATPDPSLLACAQTVQALGGCELAACEANCPVTDLASLASYEACTTAADRGGCQAYWSAASCEHALQDGGAADAGALVEECFLPSFKDFYDHVVPRFCSASAPGMDAGGPPPSDAGAAGD